MITADTITDEQIRELRDRSLAEGNLGHWNLASSGLAGSPLEHRVDLFRAIRARCAEILNAKKPKRCPVCQDGACETKSDRCGK